MRIKIAALLLISLTVLAGCGRISVYVLNQEELVKVKTGDTITAKYDGWLLSNRAVDRVMNAKIKATNLQ
jgi:hypothetical protein